MKRNCDYCGKVYDADPRNLKRGWGLCCSKSCAAYKREKSKPGYDPKRVARNNQRRENWNNPELMPDDVKSSRNYNRFGVSAPSVVGGSGLVTGITSEGYRIMDGIAYDEFDNEVYQVDPFEDDLDHGQWTD